VSDDWFERALREIDNGSESDDTDEATASDDTEPTTVDNTEPTAEMSAVDDTPTAAEDDDFGFGDFGAEMDSQASGADPAGGTDDFGFGEFGSGDGGPAGGTDDFGFGEFGGGGGPGPASFDDEALESELDRIKIGIDGLDDMIRGGVPDRSLMTVIGGAGTGKTTFGLQFIERALSNGERAVFITLEQTEESLISTAEEMGWPFEQYRDEGLLTVVVLDPVEMANSLASIRNDITRLIRDFGASRLVLDSVSLLEMMYEHPARRRSEVFNFARSLKQAGVTTMLTSEVDPNNIYASRHGMVEYLTDAVFFLQYIRTENSQETRTAIEIQKIRNASHSRERKPYEITDSGINVYQQANIF